MENVCEVSISIALSTQLWGHVSIQGLLMSRIQPSQSPPVILIGPPTSQGPHLPFVGPQAEAPNVWLEPLALQGG